jgi:hypothetical protein
VDALVGSMLDLAWVAAADAITGGRFRDDQDALDENRYVAYQDQVFEHLFTILRDAVDGSHGLGWDVYASAKSAVLHQFSLAWWAAVDAVSSPDFCLDDGTPDEAVRDEFRRNVRTEGTAKIMALLASRSS